MTLRLLDLWPDSRQRNTRLIEELTYSGPGVTEVETPGGAPHAYFVQSIDPWMDHCLSRDYHVAAVAEGRSSSPYFLDVLPDTAVAALHAREAVLVIDGSIEGGAEWPVESVAAVCDEFAARGFDPSRLLLATANDHLNATRYRLQLAAAAPAARLFLHNCYFSKAARSFSTFYGPEFGRLEDRCRDRAERLGRGLREYSCLNYLPRPHRVALISRLIADGLFEAGYISCSDLNNVLGHKKIDSSEARVTQWLTGMFDADPAMMEGATRLRQMGRLVLDEDLVESRLLDYKIPESAALDSWFSIVTETDMGSGSSIYITEKILKPIPFFHPFLVFGSPFSLRYLRSVGFKTFAPFIDESYDVILDPKARFYRAYTEVKRLIALTAGDKRRLIDGLWPVLEHNARHLLFGACDEIHHRWSKPILDAA